MMSVNSHPNVPYCWSSSLFVEGREMSGEELNLIPTKEMPLRLSIAVVVRERKEEEREEDAEEAVQLN